MKKVLTIALALCLLLGLAACGGGGTSNKIIIKVFTNLPDRTKEQGYIEQKIFDAYMAANPAVKIEIEALNEEDYKTKMKAYATGGSDLPDLVTVWGQPSFLDGYAKQGLFLALNEADYAGYGFVPGSLDGFKYDGRLYGLARNTDVMGFYYNKAIFDKLGLKVPTTYDELLALAKPIVNAGYAPVALDGADGWVGAIWITDLLVKLDGSAGYKNNVPAAIDSKNFSGTSIVKAAELFQAATNAGLFQKGFETDDYGAAQGMFLNNEAAMFYMGGWEVGMGKDNADIRFFAMPVVAGGKGAATEITAWNGGGHAVIASSKVKDEALKLLNYMYQPENWTKIMWQEQGGMSAQDFSAFTTGGETNAQKDILNVFKAATGISGTTINDRGDADFKSKFETLVPKIDTKAVKPADVLNELK